MKTGKDFVAMTMGGGGGGSSGVLSETIKSDKELADEIRIAILRVAELMNEARAQKIVVTFNINEIDAGEPPQRVFVPAIEIRKIEPL